MDKESEGFTYLR